MNSKQRIMNAMLGKEIDRVPFSPFLTYWWDNQPDSFTAQGELHFLESVGADPMFRGHWPMTANNYEDMVLFKKTIHDCEITTKIDGVRKYVTYKTSRGSLVLGYRYAAQSNSWFLVEHPVEEIEDFQLLKYIVEQTELTPDYERFDRIAEQLGDRGLMVPVICPELKSSFQSLLEHWCGTENLVCMVNDEPEVVQETLDAMVALSKKGAEISAKSNAEVFLSWEDTSTTNISPAYYRNYILPEINAWCDILHQHGKLFMQHACGKLHYLLDDMATSKIDILESVTPAPLGDITNEEVREKLPEHIAIVGGLGGRQFSDESEDWVEAEAKNLLKCYSGHRYVLANSDSCPPDVSVEKFRRMAAATRV